jgi:hypothetical protein
VANKTRDEWLAEMTPGRVVMIRRATERFPFTIEDARPSSLHAGTIMLTAAGIPEILTVRIEEIDSVTD